jgi:excisionase family DNA binding protein
MTSIDSRPLLTLAQAAERLQWSVRTLQRKLAEHGIATVGRRRLARLTEEDLERLIQAERQPTSAPPLPSPRSGPGSIRHIARALRLEAQAKAAKAGGTNSVVEDRMGAYYRRRDAQRNRRKSKDTLP